MGLIKKDGTLVKGVEIKPAYAKLMDFCTLSRKDNALMVQFGISTTRENLDNKLCLEIVQMEIEYNRGESLFNQIYTKAKEDAFKDWEDDIVEVEE